MKLFMKQPLGIEGKSMLGRRSRNLGTFSTTFMDDEAFSVFLSYASINAVDWAAYPELEGMEKACGKCLLDWHHANGDDYSYFSTSGSSEAIFLAVAHLKHHALRNNNATLSQCSLVISEQSHIAWEKAAAYLGVDIVRVDFEVIAGLQACLKSSTIGVVGSLGTTTTLAFEPMSAINQELQTYYMRTGHFIPLHIDAASGGFVVPFSQPEFVADFRLNHVQSINVSSHKFGGVYPSLGWLLMHDSLKAHELSHENTYLGKTFHRFSLQFSHSAGPLAAQSHLFHTLGYQGYKNKISKLYLSQNALMDSLSQMGAIQWVHSANPSLPGVVFSLDSKAIKTLKGLALFLKQKGWHLPVYPLNNNTQVARIVIREGFTDNLLNELVDCIQLYLKSPNIAHA